MNINTICRCMILLLLAGCSFVDLHKDLKQQVQRSQSIQALAPGTRHEMDIDLPPYPDGGLLTEIMQLKKGNAITHQKSLTQIGTVTHLDAENFSMENAEKGLWQPYQSIQTVSFGLFFLYEYDPHKKVVLFVHGVSRTPRQFKMIINNLDYDHFQPLVLRSNKIFTVG